MVARLLRLALVGLVLAAAGFAAFLAARPATGAAPPQADAAAVLTGGPGRVEAGIALLAEGRVRRLMISGVHPDVVLADLPRATELDPVRAGRVSLGRWARSTRGNAAEIAAWAGAADVQSLVVVTSRMHMRRALLEVRRAAPRLVLHPLPVEDPAGMTLLRRALPEYAKYVGALLGLGALWPARETT